MVVTLHTPDRRYCKSADYTPGTARTVVWRTPAAPIADPSSTSDAWYDCTTYDDAPIVYKQDKDSPTLQRIGNSRGRLQRRERLLTSTSDYPFPPGDDYTGSTTTYVSIVKDRAFSLFTPHLTLPPPPFPDVPSLRPFILTTLPRRPLRLMPPHSGHRWGRVKRRVM